MPKMKDISGKRYGSLVAIEFDSVKKTPKGQYYVWKFKCDCGKDYFGDKSQVTRGRVKSCGCKRNASIRESHLRRIKQGITSDHKNLHKEYEEGKMWWQT